MVLSGMCQPEKQDGMSTAARTTDSSNEGEDDATSMHSSIYNISIFAPSERPRTESHSSNELIEECKLTQEERASFFAPLPAYTPAPSMRTFTPTFIPTNSISIKVKKQVKLEASSFQ